jgi:hypothetical protein
VLWRQSSPVIHLDEGPRIDRLEASLVDVDLDDGSRAVSGIIVARCGRSEIEALSKAQSHAGNA